MPWDLRPVGPDFLDEAPFRFSATEILSSPAPALFLAIAADPAGWGRWFPGFSSSGRYITPAPFGVGSRRRMRMAGVTYDETVIAWDDPPGPLEPGGKPGRYAFRVDRTTLPLAAALAEEYRVADHGTYTTLQWTFALDPRAVLRPGLPLMEPVLRSMFQKVADGLDRWVRTAT